MVILLPSAVSGDRRIILFRRIYRDSSDGSITNNELNNLWYYSHCRGSRSTRVCGMEMAPILNPK
jgi:hypothetical protein